MKEIRKENLAGVRFEPTTYGLNITDAHQQFFALSDATPNDVKGAQGTSV